MRTNADRQNAPTTKQASLLVVVLRSTGDKAAFGGGLSCCSVSVAGLFIVGSFSIRRRLRSVGLTKRPVSGSSLRLSVERPSRRSCRSLFGLFFVDSARCSCVMYVKSRESSPVQRWTLLDNSARVVAHVPLRSHRDMVYPHGRKAMTTPRTSCP